jgi:hypothetical protein
MVKYPSLKAIQHGLAVTYKDAKAIKEAMQVFRPPKAIAIAAEKAGLDSSPYDIVGHLYESTGLYHIDADVMTATVDDRTLIHDRCDGSWYVMTEKQYRDMVIHQANYEA